jgi:hypothetical protein
MSFAVFESKTRLPLERVQSLPVTFSSLMVYSLLFKPSSSALEPLLGLHELDRHLELRWVPIRDTHPSTHQQIESGPRQAMRNLRLGAGRP